MPPKKIKPGMSQYNFILPQNTHAKLKILAMMKGKGLAVLLADIIDAEYKGNKKNIETWLDLAGITPETEAWIFGIEE